VNQLAYHGGFPGLEAGDEILPPSETGFSRALSLHTKDAFVTFNFDYALRRAVDFVGASSQGPRREAAGVYEVEIPPDVPVPAHWMGGIRVPRARITRVLVRDLAWDGSAHTFADVDPEFVEAVRYRLRHYVSGRRRDVDRPGGPTTL
jgi:hypothetical protein